MWNPGEYREKVESVRVLKNCLDVPKNDRMSVSTEKLSNPDEYREKLEFVRVPENCPDGYLKILESV